MPPQVETVLGPTPAGGLGMTLIHEHIFHDLTVLVSRPDSDSGEGFRMSLWDWRISGGPDSGCWSADNFFIDEV